MLGSLCWQVLCCSTGAGCGMSRLQILPQPVIVTGSYPNPLPPTPGSVAITWTNPTDQTDRYAAIIDLKTMIEAWNTDSVPHTITFTAVADSFNRLGSYTYTVPAGVIAPFGPFGLVGWGQTGPLQQTVLWIDVDDAKLVLANRTLP